MLASRDCDADLLKLKDDNSKTALMLAGEKGNMYIVNAMLASSHCDADLLKLKDGNGKTALMWAVEKGNIDIVNAILASGHCDADLLQLKDNDGKTALANAQNYQRETINAIVTSRHFSVIENIFHLWERVK